MQKIHKNINKKMFLYKFFKNFGKQFNPELIEEIFGINKKNMFELGGIDVKAEKTMQKVFLTILKQELDKYKDIINTDAVLDAVLINTLNYYDKDKDYPIKELYDNLELVRIAKLNLAL